MYSGGRSRGARSKARRPTNSSKWRNDPMRLAIVGSLFLLAAGAGCADEAKLAIAVTGGDHDLANVVVRVPLPAKALGDAKNVRVQEGPKDLLLLGQVSLARLLGDAGSQR